MLNTENTSHIYLLGRYADDLYVRFSYTDVPPEKLSAYENISEGVDAAVRDGVTQAYTITCFSDKGQVPVAGQYALKEGLHMSQSSFCISIRI